MKNPKAIQVELRKATSHPQEITEVRQFGRGGILCCPQIRNAFVSSCNVPNLQRIRFVSFAARCFHYVGPLHDSGALRFTVSDSPRSCPAFEFPYGFGESSDYPRRVRDGKSKSPGDSLQSSGECAAAVGCEVPSSLSLQSTTYSPYKSSNTFKGLIGVLPNGLVAFVSELFTGSSSDRECVIRSGFLDLKFDDEDAVMADKGFRIEELLEKNGVKLNLPPFLKGGTFSPEEVKSTKEIAALRIHVERRIQRIKAFHIFDRPIPLTLAPLINQIWTVTAILSNFQSSLMQQSSGKPQQEP
ncbi:hypothetical protein HPB51_018290 [Rhipicephalus microplus]|uniref:DDE Tnp4 domain-containing protein n=1 Tax=Rhipicephalus microplus TaxID=6941 RepID=A0A9J6D6C0_RHIMP|nr:hypothetical protein HPB51_018290 [Rhipicephalus microplus]